VSALAAGGRLDPWSAVLADGATAGVALGGADASLVEGGREAFTLTLTLTISLSLSLTRTLTLTLTLTLSGRGRAGGVLHGAEP